MDCHRFYPSRPALQFGLILILAVILRFCFGMLHPSLGRDEIYYLEMADALQATGKVPSNFGNQPPLLIFLLNFFACCGMTPGQVAGTVTRIAGILFVIPWWWIGRQLFSVKWGAPVLMGLAAVAPYPVLTSNQVLREALSLPIAAWLFLFLLRYWERPLWKPVIAIAVLGAIGNNSRYEFCEWLLVFAASAIWAAWQRKISWPVAAGQIGTATVIWGGIAIGLLWSMGFDIVALGAHFLRMLGVWG